MHLLRIDRMLFEPAHFPQLSGGVSKAHQSSCPTEVHLPKVGLKIHAKLLGRIADGTFKWIPVHFAVLAVVKFWRR
jgi:hypothetical protein